MKKIVCSPKKNGFVVKNNKFGSKQQKNGLFVCRILGGTVIVFYLVKNTYYDNINSFINFKSYYDDNTSVTTIALCAQCARTSD